MSYRLLHVVSINMSGWGNIGMLLSWGDIMGLSSSGAMILVLSVGMVLVVILHACMVLLCLNSIHTALGVSISVVVTFLDSSWSDRGL